jgi:LacI family transcriptional regulator
VNRVTLHDVAREVGVHPSTVSRALDPGRAHLVKESTRETIMAVARRLGYRPHMVARGLQTGRTLTVGVVVADLGNTFVTPIIHGLTAALEEQGTMPVIAETQDDHNRFSQILDHLLSRRVDAIVSLATRADDREMVESAARIAPVVIAARPLAHTTLPQVVHDDRAGARMAAEHLTGLEHRMLAQLRGPLDVENFARRAEGFSVAVHRAGATEITLDAFAYNPVIEEGARLMGILLARGDLPTAVFVHNDLMAAGALAVLHEHGIRVPADVSIVGYNDLPVIGFLDPPLTTVRYPGWDVGRAAGEMARRLVAGEPVENVIIEAPLVVRKSTGPPRTAHRRG